MADIDVVKKGSHTWLWIIIILVILLAVFFLFARNPETRTGLLNEKGGQPFAAAPPHVTNHWLASWQGLAQCCMAQLAAPI